MLTSPNKRRLRAAAMALLTLMASCWALWSWTGSAGSLETGLKILSRVLPNSQSLRFERVQGNLRHGGTLAHLNWRQDGLNAQVQGLDLKLNWQHLWQGQLPIESLHVQQLVLAGKRPASAAQPPASLMLPMRVDLSWTIDRWQSNEPTPISMSNLRGHYRFDGKAHQLDLLQVDMAQGRYRGQARLQATAPMTLDARADGEITTPATGRHPATTLKAQAQLQGQLEGMQAKLRLQIKARPAQDPQSTMGLQLDAVLHPWLEQSVATATLQASQVDLASLWPGAPHTLVSGNLQAVPHDQRWRLRADLTNTLPGPWDLQRLPLQKLHIDIVRYGITWQLDQLQIQWPQGGAQAQGQWTPQGWSGEVSIRQLSPALWHSAWRGPAWGGTVQANQQGTGVQFDARLQAPGPHGHNATRTDLQDGLRALGQWHPGQWTFDEIDLRLDSARLQARGHWHTSTPSLQGEWSLSGPGLQASWQGTLAPRNGQGQLQLHVQDARRSLQWLQRWPQLKDHLSPLQAQGQLAARATWHGGWQSHETEIALILDAPQLEVASARTGVLQWQEARLQVNGSLKDMQVQAQGMLQTPQQVAHIQTRLQIGLDMTKAPMTHWHGQWREASVRWQSRPATLPLHLQLQTPVDWLWHPGADTLQWQTSQWSLQGQPSEMATLRVNRGEWVRASSTRATDRLQFHAEVADVPAQWTRALGLPEVQGDMRLQGQIQMTLGDKLAVHAQLERSKGRLLMVAETPSAEPVDAGVKQAQVVLTVSDQEAQLRLQWESEQAGQLQALLHSRIPWSEYTGATFTEAPLTGKVTARLPKVSAWSWLAPPGWRVQGSLDATFDVTGTLARPSWNGTLQADNLAVRSAVQGIEFQQGQLRARLQDQQMVLEQMSLKGAGAQGGDLSATGQIGWPSIGTKNLPIDAVEMDLRITAKRLRVSNRADRRLTVSGEVNGRMRKGQMVLRGDIQADQALFILPEDSTPTLGDDVTILQKQQLTSSPRTRTPSLVGTPDVQVMLKLGPDFQVQGHGVTTRLAGQLTLVSHAANRGQPHLSGQVQTVGGRFKAYGQHLDIEQGLLRFNGPFDNPDLDILALRPNLPQRVGVSVTGTALTPRIRLYSDPEMADADKLGWLVLGRSPAGGGAESAVLQQAALSLLGGTGKTLSGELANALGIDEISLASRSEGTATGAAITLGKRLSKDFYMAYESSVSGAFGSLYVFYDLSRRLTLRAQAGDLNALDLIYTIRKD